MQPHTHHSNYAMRFYDKLKDSVAQYRRKQVLRRVALSYQKHPNLGVQLAEWDYPSWTSVHPRGGGEPWPTPILIWGGIISSSKPCMTHEPSSQLSLFWRSYPGKVG